jgi:hypothetical protein
MLTIVVGVGVGVDDEDMLSPAIAGAVVLYSLQPTLELRRQPYGLFRGYEAPESVLDRRDRANDSSDGSSNELLSITCSLLT